MNYKIYQIDAFANELFAGNPAAVCPLDKWLNDTILQKIAMENNLAETAFYVKNGQHYELRWFTPTVEVDLCGHATLAAAFVLFEFEHHSSDSIEFHSRKSGILKVKRAGDLLTLDFPTDEIKKVNVTDKLTNGFNIRPQHAFKGKTDYLLIFKNEEEIVNLMPDFDEISKLDVRGVIVTAKGEKSDFVSRFFAPQSGVSEDPVTGSAHTTLTPYWSGVLGKKELSAVQLSKRKGYLQCKLLTDRVEISGKAKLYLKGEIFIP